MPAVTITSGFDNDLSLVNMRRSAEGVARSAHRVLGEAESGDRLAVLSRQIDHLQRQIDAIRGDDATLLADLDRWLENLRLQVERHPVNSGREVGF